MTNSSGTNLNSHRLALVRDRDVPHNPDELTVVSDSGERTQPTKRQFEVRREKGYVMRYIAGIDIGNSSTEVALATLDEAGALTITHSALAETTGIKGTLRNVFGIQEALALVARGAGIAVSDISLIRINEATPVIGDVAMETITETIITESTMIGHNPKTPGGAGLGTGITITPQELLTRPADAPYILVVSSAFDFADIASVINASLRAGYQITGVILQRDDGVLVSNRLEKPLPIVDEVLYIDRIPLGMLAAIEVAVPGKVIETLSNPYGIATVFNLSPEETKNIVPMARALIGNRSAVVVKTPSGDVKARAIPAGNLELLAQGRSVRVDVAAGAEAIMKAVDGCGRLDNVTGESGTNIGGMLEHVRQTMAELTNKPSSEIFIQDLLAVDTSVPVSVTGGLAGEFSLEQAVGIASMVKSDRLQMAMIAREIEQKLNIDVQIGGAEAEAAILGALTTPTAGDPRPRRGLHRCLHHQPQRRHHRHPSRRRRRHGDDDYCPRAGAGRPLSGGRDQEVPAG